MLIYDDIFHWDGFGGKLRLVSGKCRLRILDRNKANDQGLPIMRPMLVIVTDIEGETVSVKSCAGHIATLVTQQFNINPSRMFWIEYYPETAYGKNRKKKIEEKFEAVEFEWHNGMAIHPKWRPVPQPIIDIVKSKLFL